MTVDGFTHASSVIPVDRCSDAASGTVTSAFDPLKQSALPNFPALDQVAPLTAPVLPFPDGVGDASSPCPRRTRTRRPGRPTAACVVAVAVFE